MQPVLLAGEIFPAPSSAKGSVVATDVRKTNGAVRFLAAMASADIRVVQIGGGQCESEFPTSVDALSTYSCVVLSDVEMLSLLYTPETHAGLRSVNRLELLRMWVEAGGSLMMAGGYASFQGMDGMALFHGTPVEECLPVECRPGPDGLEAPEGLDPIITIPNHPLLDGIFAPIPYVLGMNRVVSRTASDATTLLHVDHRGTAMPLLAVRNYGAGRTLAWMTDIGPHWLSRDFLDWQGYDRLMANMVRWLAREI